MKLNGYSLSNEELGNFISQLSMDSIFNNVRLKYAQESEILKSNRKSGDPIKVIQFEIECDILTG